MTATASQLHDAVVSTLEGNGRLEKINSQLRAELFQLLTQANTNKNISTEYTRQCFLVNELIREYMQFNGYSNSLSVFLRESNQPKEPMNRDFLAQSLNIEPHKQIPMLYSITNINDQNDTVDALSNSEMVPDHVKIKPLVEDSSDEDFFVINSV